MAGRLKIAGGAVILIVSAALFVMDFVYLSSIILEVLAIFAFATAILSGRKLSLYIHDLHLAAKRNYHLGPALFIYVWLIMFVLFLILYTVTKIYLGYIIKIALLPLGGSYFAIIYNVLALLSSYILFSGLYESKDIFLTMWGKAAEKSSETIKPAEGMARKSMKVGEGTVKNFEDEMKRWMP